jgi:hypothetical protein
MSVRSLLRAVNSAENADQLWAVQRQLSHALEVEEAIITKRRRQASHLARGKKNHAHSEFRSIDRIQRYQRLISTCRWNEERHLSHRGAVLYLGDTLAFKLLPEHHINVLCQNGRPGFFARKKGRKLEVQAGEFAVSHGDLALLHDLTHCLRIGDLTFVKDGFPPALVEFESGRRYSPRHHRRKERQHERLRLVGKVLNGSVERIDAEALHRYSLPTAFVEQEREFNYHVQAFEQVSRIGPRGYTIVHPEPGLVYIATEPDCPSTEFMQELTSTVQPCRCGFVRLRARVEGHCPWVPPITLLPIDEDVVVRYLDQEFNLFVYLDLDQVVRRLEQSGSRLQPIFGMADSTQHQPLDELGGWFMFEADCGDDWRVYVGPKVLHRVLFGLATLDSAVQALAQAGNVPSHFLSDLAVPD